MTEVKEQNELDDSALLVATLRIPDQGTLSQEGSVPVVVTGFRIHHRCNDMESMEDEDRISDSTKQNLLLNFSIENVVSKYDPAAPGNIFHGMVVP